MANPIALLMIAAYMVATTAVGMLMVRRSRGSDDWSIAGGRMGAFLIAVGIAGTRIGGAATYGVAGDVITGGVWNMWWYGISAFLAMALVGLFFAVPYRRLKIQTVGEIFTLRFGTRRSQWVTSLCVQTEYAIINVIEPLVIGRIFAPLTGMPFGAAVGLGTLCLISYTALGGLWGGAATNLIHSVAILAGLSLVGLAGVTHLGGWENVVTSVNAALATTGADPAAWWGFAGAGWMAWSP